jgi:hypothetical protein
VFASPSTKLRRRWKKCFYGIVVALVTAFTGIFLADSRAKPAPTYNGISINRWIEISSGTREISNGLAEVGPEKADVAQSPIFTMVLLKMAEREGFEPSVPG